LISTMSWYRENDEQIADGVLTSMKRHLWYLTEELVVFSIFDDTLSPLLRSELAKTLFNTPKPESFQQEKPRFPILDDGVPELPSLIGPRSWLLFHLLSPKSRHEWLQLPPNYWELMEDLKKMNDFVLNVEVVNDCAERGIHLINDFKNSTFDENQQEYLFQVVENNRKRIDSLKKSDLSGI